MFSRGLNISSRIVDTKTKYFRKAQINCKSEIENLFQNSIKILKLRPFEKVTCTMTEFLHFH